jgi:UDP-N-acetylmuramyl pentapeptide phosphotransferase/UDP-N-acetylglucosamine-1-phosphate transferase
MSHLLISVVVFALSASLSGLFVWKAIEVGRRLGIMDLVDDQRVHTVARPRSGGVAMFAAFVVGVAVTYSFNVRRYSIESERLLLLLAGAALIVCVMVVDDAVGIAPLPKLLWQIGAALLVVVPRFRDATHGIVIDSFNAPFVGEVRLPVLAAAAATVFWIVGMMNTINWVDGLDGLAASVTLVACAVLFLHTYFWPRANPQFTISLLPLVIAAVVVGFLPFNWSPSRIIMGDAGSNFLGYSLAIASIIGGAKIATALLALGLPIMDVAWVIFYRVAHGRSPVMRDRGHLHHRLLDEGWSESKIVLFVAGISALFGASALLLPSKGAKLAAMVAIGLVLMAILGWVATRADRPRPPASQERPI